MCHESCLCYQKGRLEQGRLEQRAGSPSARSKPSEPSLHQLNLADSGGPGGPGEEAGCRSSRAGVGGKWAGLWVSGWIWHMFLGSQGLS